MLKKNYYITGEFKSINIFVGDNNSGRTEFLNKLRYDFSMGNKDSKADISTNINISSKYKIEDNYHFWIKFFGFKINEYELNNLPHSSSLQQLLGILNILNNGENEPIILIDEPENHFHPNKHDKLAELILSQTKENKSKTFVITNSPFLVKSFQLMVFLQELSLSQLGIFYFMDCEDEIEVRELELNKDGQFLNKYPDDLFEVFYNINKRFYLK